MPEIQTKESMEMAAQFMRAWWGPTVTDGLAEPLAALLDRARLQEAKNWHDGAHQRFPQNRLVQLAKSAALFQCEVKP